MTLSNDDLKAIKTVVKDTVEPMIDGLAISTARGFEEVHSKIDKLDIKIDGVETRLGRKIKNLTIRQEETLGFVLQHEPRIEQLETNANTK